MRAIQQSNKRFKKYFALSMSITAFGILWCCGAVGFWRAEQDTQNLTYFQALYFCYVSLLTIGYGDLSPRSNAGKPFFIVWSLLAVPTMTILISDMGDTVVASYKRGTFTLADWTILLRKDFFQTFQSNHPRVSSWLTQKAQSRKEKERIEAGFQVGPAPPDPTADIPTLESLAHEDALNERELARKLTLAIRHMADNIKLSYQPRYSYEEWVEFTRLIRFTRHYNSGDTLKREEEDGGIIDWDWIGDDSPMMADDSESRWILDRLCESLDRYVKRSVMNGNSGIHKDFKDLKSPNRDTFEWNRRGTAFSNLDRGKEERVTRGSRSASAPKVTSMAALRMKQR